MQFFSHFVGAERQKMDLNIGYRLVFLLLCIPQLQDWQIRCEGDKAAGIAELSLFCTVLGVLWLNGNANGPFDLPFARSCSTGSYSFVWPRF
jgi:hypothetical protein